MFPVINCDHNTATILPDGNFDPQEICGICVAEEAQRRAIQDGGEFEYVLELLWDSIHIIEVS
jgi:hypothetical protein